jgi:Leucine-rich repeat (LRR) protein
MLGDDTTEDADQLSSWMQPLQTLSVTPNVQLRVEWVGVIIADLDHPCIAQWLKQLGKLISHLTVAVEISNDRLKLRDFAVAAAPCRSINLTIWHGSNEILDLADLAPIAGSLNRLSFEPNDLGCGWLKGASSFSSMSQLTTLHVHRESFGTEEPWVLVAKLSNLQELSVNMSASGNPSPLSALTALSSLYLRSCEFENLEVLGADIPAPFSFSSLQPLSTLQQLEELHLGSSACGATSLQGLAGLSNLKQLGLDFVGNYRGKLRSLNGVSPGVRALPIEGASNLVSLAGIESCTSLEKLLLKYCGVSSLQPLKGLSCLKELVVYGCHITNMESVCSMALQRLLLMHCPSLSQLSEIQHLSSMKSLEVMHCGVTSLQPLSQLGEGLQRLSVFDCSKVREEVLQLPHVQPTADVVVKCSSIKEVVLAGGVKRAVRV